MITSVFSIISRRFTCFSSICDPKLNCISTLLLRLASIDPHLFCYLNCFRSTFDKFARDKAQEIQSP
jgi:hypothetical protein